MLPRLRLDIGWSDLFSALLPPHAGRMDLEQGIAAYAPADCDPVVALSVRTLYDAILAETGNAPVVMSAVTINDMAQLVHASGRALHTVDIGTDTLTPSPEAVHEACQQAGASMVVIAQLYGSRVDLAPIAAAHDTRPLLIEDCAQAFDGSLRLPDAVDVALYSFGPIKVATALGGAIGLFRDAGLAERVKRRIAAYEALPESWFLKRTLKFLGLKVLNLTPVYTAFFAALHLMGREPDKVLGGMARGFAAGLPITEAVRRRPPQRMLALLERRLRKWKPRPDATHQLLTRLSEVLTAPGSATKPRHWWLAPVMTDDPTELVAALRRRGFDATTGATAMGVIADSAGGVAPEAQRMIKSIVYLPKPRDTATATALAEFVETALIDSSPASSHAPATRSA